MQQSRSSSPLLSTRCRIPGKSLWLARAQLFKDKIQLSGWNWSGWYERTLDLTCVERVQWWAVKDDVNFMIHLDCGRKQPLQLFRGAGMWNCRLHELCGLPLLEKSILPHESSAARTPDLAA